MSIRTSKEYQADADYDSWHDTYRDEALAAFYKEAEKEAQRIEHFIDDDELTVYIDNVVMVGDTIRLIYTIGRHYTFNEPDGYRVFEYDFRQECEEFLKDRFGFGLGTGEVKENIK